MAIWLRDRWLRSFVGVVIGVGTILTCARYLSPPSPSRVHLQPMRFGKFLTVLALFAFPISLLLTPRRPMLL
jgi:hypothetical protein